MPRDPHRGGRAPSLTALEKRLLNEFQRDLPLVSRPFASIGQRLGAGEATVLRHLDDLQRRGFVSRVGPVLRPQRVGASTLAAMAVPAPRLDEVAVRVSALPEVNHNYEREHRLNLWFVLVADDEAGVRERLARIKADTGLAVLSLPMIEDYHIDLAFPLDAHAGTPPRRVCGRRGPAGEAARGTLSEEDRRLLRTTQGGLPLLPRPYAAVARAIGMRENDVVTRLARLLETGMLKRIGVVVRHHELGYRANAMVVWNVPDGEVDERGRCIARDGVATLCYRRPRRPPLWNYNLFCMLHGRDRESVHRDIEALAQRCGLQDFAYAILFSRRRFKQCGARYPLAPAEVPGRA